MTFFTSKIVRICLGWDQGPPELPYLTLCPDNVQAYVNKFGMLQDGKKDN